MLDSIFFEKVKILYGENQPITINSALIINGRIEAFGKEARAKAQKIKIEPRNDTDKLLAPLLVDPHSLLQDPVSGRCENLKSLKNAAANAGYGQIAILPKSKSFRDSSETLWSSPKKAEDVIIHFFGNFSQKGEGQSLSKHADLIHNGAVGLADDDYLINLSLLQKGLVLGDMGISPILIAPRDKDIQGNGIVREGVEVLRAGWHPDPKTSETLPLRQIIELHQQYPEKSIRIMNISTKDSVSILKESNSKMIASVCWWHLLVDRTKLSPCDIGLKVTPSLGGSEDRHALINGVKSKIIKVISVNSVPLDAEEIELPPEKRLSGISGHQLVLPALWQELVLRRGFSIEELWSAISFGPSRMINSEEEILKVGSKRWLLFDPNHKWVQNRSSIDNPNAANQPWEGKEILGKVILCGLKT